MNSTLYLRRWNLTVYTFRGSAISPSSELRMTFSIDLQTLREMQFAEITLYNLSRDTETDILKNGQSVTLEAGYQNGAYGVIYTGLILQVIRGKDDAVTYTTKLICVTDPINRGVTSLTVTGGQTAQQIIQQIARSSSVPFDVTFNPSDLGSFQLLYRGKTVFGKTIDVLRSIAIQNNAMLYADGNGMMVSSLSAPPPAGDQIIELNVESGMIGMPTQTDNGIQVKSLINPNIRLDRWFHINNASVILRQITFGDLPPAVLDRDGIYRIIGLNISGDTRGNDWYMELEAINQVSALPQMLSDASQTGL